MGNFSTIVQISNGICQYERKYAVLNKNLCHFLGPWPSMISGKKSKAQKRIQNDATLRYGFFFPENALGDGPAFWIFPGFTDKG